MATYSRVVTESSDGVISQDTTGNAATASAVAYSGLTGTAPTWNQDTTGTAAKASAIATAGNISIAGDATASAVKYTSGGDVALSLSLGTDVVGADELADGAIKEANLLSKGGALSGGQQGQFLACGGNGIFEWQNQTSANNATMSISAGDGLQGGGSFTGNQADASTVTLSLSENVAGDGLSYETGELSIASSVAGTGLSHSGGVLSVDAAQAITSVTGDFAIAGDLTVSGKTITTTTEELEINDNTLKLNADSKSAVDAGFLVETNADDTNAEKGMLFYDASKKKWMAGTTTSGAFTGAGVKALEVQVRNVRDSFDANDTNTPIGGFQVVGGSIFLRTS